MSGLRRHRATHNDGTDNGVADDGVADDGVADPAWCETCRHEVAVEDLGDGDTCPTCGEAVTDRRRVPWTFKLMIVATVIYLGYRLYQGIGWAIHHV